MFIDFLGLPLLAIVSGLVVLALYLYVGPEAEEQPKWAPAFGAAGLLALVTGLWMSLTWPLPGSFNIAFGDLAALFGLAYLAGAWSLTKGYGLGLPVVWSLFGSVTAIEVGFRLISLHMTKSPAMAGIAYILAGVGGLLTVPAALLPKNRPLRLLAALVLLVAAALWAATTYPAYWDHLASFSKWVPATMRVASTAAKAS